MKSLRITSLELRLAGLLGGLFLATTIVAVAILFLETSGAVRSLSNQNLLERARLLGQAFTPGGAFVLPPGLDGLYSDAGQPEVYAIRRGDGTILAASGPDIQAWVAGQAMPANDPGIFKLNDFGPAKQEYYGLSILLDTASEPLAVTVANAGDDDPLLHAMVDEFVEDVAWVIPVFIVVTLLVGVFAIRSGLRPVREIAGQAAAIEPGAMSLRLDKKDLPVEILPLVEAVNKALDRLEAGFDQQRRFTANAAHELRTPLTIITGALEMLPGNGELEKIKTDVTRMNRLIDQLLRVARLDAVRLDVSEKVNLNATAGKVIEYLAPLAIAQSRTIALECADSPVWVNGNQFAIEDAIRNLLENAISHTPANTEVVVKVSAEGKVKVIDKGEGVDTTDIEQLFERFWRGRRSPGTGAGLGLSIVNEIMKAHHGSVEVSNEASGGACFALNFSSNPFAVESADRQRNRKSKRRNNPLAWVSGSRRTARTDKNTGRHSPASSRSSDGRNEDR